MDSGLDLFYEQCYGNRWNLPCFYINSPRIQCRHLTVYRYAAISSSLMKNIINCRKLSKVSSLEKIILSLSQNKAKDFRQSANIQKGTVTERSIMVAVDALNKLV